MSVFKVRLIIVWLVGMYEKDNATRRGGDVHKGVRVDCDDILDHD